MEINTSILQGLASVIAGSQARPEQSESAQSLNSGQVYQNPPGDQINGADVSTSNATGTRVGDDAQVLSVSEREILGLLFGEQGELAGSIYQPQTSKPAALGNFVDIRG
jgi:hypothetical protein